MFTGSSIEGTDQPRDLARESVDLMRSLGIPDRALVPLKLPLNTSQEIPACRDLARDQGWKRVGLITSAWHMPRALRLSAAAGFAVVPLRSDHRGLMPPPSLLWLIPHERGFLRVQLACWELLGMAVGR